MDNLAAPAQFLVPTIPPGVCFEGTITDKLNQFSQQYLANATINIPGLGDITPTEIQELSDRVQTLQNQVDALAVGTRYGSLALAVGDQNIPITFSTVMPNTNYSIDIEIVDATGNGTTAVSWAVVGGTKLTTGVTIRFYDVTSSQTSFSYTIRQYPA